DLALDVHGDLLAQVTVGDGGGHFRDVTDLAGEVAGHAVDAVGQVLPDAGHPAHHGLAAQLALGAHFEGHARHYRAEAVELAHHALHGALPIEDLAPDIHRHLLAQVAHGHRGGDLRDVADLGGEVASHAVDAVGEVLPGAGHPLDLGLAAQP